MMISKKNIKKLLSSLFCVNMLLACALFASCDHSPEDEETTEETTTEETTTEEVKAVPSDATAIVDFSSLTELPSTITVPTWGGSLSLVDDSTYGKVAKATRSGDNWGWANFTITPSSSLNLKGKTLYILAKGKADDSGTIAVNLVSDDNAQSIIYPNFTDDSNFVEYSFVIDDITETDKDSLANTEAISSIVFYMLQTTYDFEIAAIYYK